MPSKRGFKKLKHRIVESVSLRVSIWPTLEEDSGIPSIFGPTELRRLNMYDTDASIVPVAASYAAIGLFLEDAAEGRKLQTPDVDLCAFSFKRLGDNWLACLVSSSATPWVLLTRSTESLGS